MQLFSDKFGHSLISSHDTIEEVCKIATVYYKIFDLTKIWQLPKLLIRHQYLSSMDAWFITKYDNPDGSTLEFGNSGNKMKQPY